MKLIQLQENTSYKHLLGMNQAKNVSGTYLVNFKKKDFRAETSRNLLITGVLVNSYITYLVKGSVYTAQLGFL